MPIGDKHLKRLSENPAIAPNPGKRLLYVLPNRLDKLLN